MHFLTRFSAKNGKKTMFFAIVEQIWSKNCKNTRFLSIFEQILVKKW